MASARLQKDFEEMKKSPPAMCSAGPINRDMFNWQGVIMGPKGSAYDNGIFKISLQFSQSYPQAPPRVTFTNNVYHMNVRDGEICLDILRYNWKPTMTVKTILLALCALLSNPNPNSPLRREIAVVYQRNRPEYDRLVKEHVRIYNM